MPGASERSRGSRFRFVALANVRAVGVVDEDLLGPEEGAGAGVLGAACLVRLPGGAEAAERVPSRDGQSGGRCAAVDGDHGDRSGQGGQQPGEGERGVVEVRRDDDGAPGRGVRRRARVLRRGAGGTASGRGVTAAGVTAAGRDRAQGCRAQGVSGSGTVGPRAVRPRAVGPKGWRAQGAGAPAARGMSSGARTASQAASSPSQRPGTRGTVPHRTPGGRSAASAGGVRRSHSRSKTWSG